MTDADDGTLVELLRRHVETRMDQWELWLMETRFGTAYLSLSLEPAPGATPDAYTWVPAPPQAGDRQLLAARAP